MAEPSPNSPLPSIDLSAEGLLEAAKVVPPSVDPADRPLSQQEKTSAAVNAELLQMLEMRRDPRETFPIEKGWLGQKDVFDYNIEKGFSPRVREFVRNYYGPAEMQYDPEGSNVGNLWRRVFGDTPTAEELDQIKVAQDIRAGRTSGSASERYKRAIGEITSGAPSPAEIRGDLPEGVDLPPWLQELAQVGRRVQLPKVKAQVLLRDYGIRQGTDQDQRTIKRTRAASNSLNQLESISPGLSQATLGPILAEDFNVHYGLTGTDREVTAESLNIRQINYQGSQKLVYTHPETKKPTMFDPIKLELRDVAELLPELIVIGGDITGMLVGTPVGGAAGAVIGQPATGAAIGNIFGGATGAFYGRMKAQKMALTKNEFAYDPRFNGFVKEGYNDEAGNPKVITEMELYKNAMSDALYSLGGNIGLRAIFKLGKVLLFGDMGKEVLRGSLSADEFVAAIDKFRGSRLGTSAAQPWGAPTNTSMALHQQGEELIKQSRLTQGTDARNLFELGQKYLEQAEILRVIEGGTTAGAQRETLKEGVIREAQVTAGVTPAKVAAAEAGDVAAAVEKGLPVIAKRDVLKQANELISNNNTAMREFADIVEGATARSADELGEALATKAQAIMGTADGKTGLYGVYNTIGDALSKPAFVKGVPLKPFEISNIKKLVDTIQSGARPGEASAAIGGAFPSKFLSEWNTLLGRVGTKAGKAQGIVNLNYGQLRDLIISLRAELGSKSLNQVQRKNMVKMLTELEGVQIKGLQAIDDAGAAAGMPTTYAKQAAAADAHFKELAGIWQRGLTKGLETGTYGQIAGKLFGDNATPGFVGNVMATIRPGKNQLNLMRETLLYRYKETMQGLARGEVDLGADIAGQRMTMPLLKDSKMTVTPASQAAHDGFIRKNRSWIDTLFKEGEFEKLGEAVTTSARTAADFKKLQKFNEALRTNPLFGGAFVKINRDLSKVAVDDAQLLMDVAFNLPPGARQQGVQALFNALKGLPKAERLMARENIRALAFRRLMNPDELIAATRDAPAGTAYKGAAAAASELKANAAVYNMIFGKSHRKDLEVIFKDLSTVTAETTQPALAAATQKKYTGVPLSAAQVYVGVLNRRARALTKGHKIFAERLDRKFRAALLDPEKAARLVKLRNTNLRTKFGINALGQILGIEIGEAIRAVDEFGFSKVIPPTVPESSLEAEALALPSMAEGGLNEVPEPFATQEGPMPPQQRRRDLNFKALEGGGLTKTEEIEKLELDKNNIVRSIETQIEDIRRTMAEGFGYERVGKGIGELLGIEAQAPSNWRTHPEIKALMDKVQETKAIFDARIDEVAAAP